MSAARQSSGEPSRALSPRELAASAGISTDTLRYYERSGVLPKPARTRGGYRRYSPAAVRRVAMIRRALAIGFSIKDLSRVLRDRDQGGSPCRKVRAIVSDRLSRIDAELTALAALKVELEALLAEWDAKLAATPDNTQARLLESLGRATPEPTRKAATRAGRRDNRPATT
jgi:DNA-binding transcriptional MerR regulator